MPYALLDRGNGVWWVWIYDSNHPGDTNPHVIIDTRANTWSYDLDGDMGVWSGDAASHSLDAIPISLYSQTPVCPWCTDAISAENVSNDMAQISYSGACDFQITNSDGQRLGVLDGQQYEEMPGAFLDVLATGLGEPATPFAHVPAGDTYKIAIQGDAANAPARDGEVLMFGPGYVVHATSFASVPGAPAQLSVSPDGRTVDLTSGVGGSVALALTSEEPTRSNTFDIHNLNLKAGGSVNFQLDPASSRLLIRTMKSSNTTYDFAVFCAGEGGQQIFASNRVTLKAADTHALDYASWNGTGPLTLVIDVGSTGTVTRTVLLNNAFAPQLYLPQARK